MIGNVVTGHSFAGCARYVLGKEGAKLLSREFVGATVPEMTQEAARYKSMNARLAKECFHATLSLPPGEELTDKQWVDISKRYMDEMGLGNTPWFVAKHTDTANPHVHLVAMRVDRDTGKTPAEWRSFEKSATIIQGIEKDYGLTPGAMTPKQAREMKVRPVPGPERLVSMRLDKEPPRRVLNREIAKSINRGATTMSRLAVALDKKGIRMVPNVSPTTGRVSGLRYRVGEYQPKASDLGRRFGFDGLQRIGVEYIPARDLPTLFAAAGREPSPELTAHIGAARERQGFRPLPEYPAPAPVVTPPKPKPTPAPKVPETPRPAYRIGGESSRERFARMGAALDGPRYSAPRKYSPGRPPPDMPAAPPRTPKVLGDPAILLDMLGRGGSASERRFQEWRLANPDRDPYRPRGMPPDMPYPPKGRDHFDDPETELRQLKFTKSRDKHVYGKVRVQTQQAVKFHEWRRDNPERDPHHPSRQPTRGRGDDFLPDR